MPERGTNHPAWRQNLRGMTAMTEKTPCMEALKHYRTLDPAYVAPEEIRSDPPVWERTAPDDTMPGGGMERYSFLYVGEEDGHIMIVDQGKVLWSYDTGSEAELDDVWMLSNGNILFSHMYWCAEVTPEKERVFYYKFPKGEESHSLQPIGLDRVLMVVNAPVPRVEIMEKATGKVLFSREIPYEPGHRTHTQFRRIRMTAEGTFLICYLELGKVVEFDTEMNVLREIKSPRPWSAIKLHNGNILVTDETELTIKEYAFDGEDDLSGHPVWELTAADLPARYAQTTIFDRPAGGPDSPSGLDVEAVGWQSCVRLANGNTVLCSQGSLGRLPQFTEVTPEKEVVWALRNFRGLGPATSIQILSDPGIPEVPGDCQR